MDVASIAATESDRVYALAQRSFLILFWVGFFALFRGFSQIRVVFDAEAVSQMDATEVAVVGETINALQAEGIDSPSPG